VISAPCGPELQQMESWIVNRNQGESMCAVDAQRMLLLMEKQRTFRAPDGEANVQKRRGSVRAVPITSWSQSDRN